MPIASLMRLRAGQLHAVAELARQADQGAFEQGEVDRRAVVQVQAAVRAATATAARARSRRWRRLPSASGSARSRCRRARRRGSARRLRRCSRSRRGVIVPSARLDQRRRGVTTHVVAQHARAGSAPACARRRSRAPAGSAPDARPRCRRGRRRLRAACRRARGPARASLAASSPAIGICAAMPPIACAPRRWQVWISSSE